MNGEAAEVRVIIDGAEMPLVAEVVALLGDREGAEYEVCRGLIRGVACLV